MLSGSEASHMPLKEVRIMESVPKLLRILCVDDENAMLDTYRRILICENNGNHEVDNEVHALEAHLFGTKQVPQTQTSFEVVTCRQGDAAVDVIRQALSAGDPFPVVFLDVRMPPGPDGIVTAERIRALDREIAIVLVTAYSDTDPQQIAERVSCAGGGLYYLQKPVHRFEVWQLATALSSAWDTRRQLREAQNHLEEANTQLRQDIVKRSRIERELESRKRELESLFYTLSHDLCAPVVSIAGFTSLLSEQCAGSLNDEGLKFLDRLQANLGILTTMLHGARGLSEAIRESGTRTSVAAADAVSEAIRRLADLIDQTGAVITLEENLPQVMYHREGLVQIFSQLIENGILFAQDGVKPHLRVACEQQTSFNRFFIQDNGIGFPQPFRQRVFDAFVRLQPDKSTGAGVGLAVVRRIVEDNGGQVGAESVPGEGSTFWFTVPIELDTASKDTDMVISAA